MDKIKYNKKIHDKVFHKYNEEHKEIYNEYEQNRLRKKIGEIVSRVDTDSINVLDVGAGTGNLTKYFLEFKAKVTASDVSINSLEYLKNRFPKYKDNIFLKVIEDENLPFDNEIFDITATYSVLHHIPDYLNTVKEMIRVTKKGGYIYIDHEGNENKRKEDKYLIEYLKLGNPSLKKRLKELFIDLKILSYNKWKTFFIEKFIDPRFQVEGDIHVWKDDHIEWDKIKEIFRNNNCEIIEEVDFLLYNPNISLEKYEYFKNITSDTKYIIAKKLL